MITNRLLFGFLLAIFALSCSEKAVQPEKPLELTCEVRKIQPSQTPPSTVYFDVVVSGGKQPYDYHWNIAEGVTSSDASPTHVFQTIGSYLVVCVVSSNDGQTAEDSVIVTVTDYQPVKASAVASPSRGQLPFTATLLGSATGGNPPYAYAWFLQNSQTPFANSQNAEFTPQSAGSWQFVLHVTSADGKTDTDTVSVTASVEAIPNQVPVAKISVDRQFGKPGDMFEFTAEQSYDSDGELIRFSWDFGDGQVSSGETTNHSFMQAGLFKVQLEIEDDSGAVAWAETYVKIDTTIFINIPPIARLTATPLTGLVNQTQFTFSTAGSYDPDHEPQILRSMIWFGDGDSTTATEASHTYTRTGTYTVSLRVFDGQDFGFDQLQIEVDSISEKPNMPPIAIADCDTTRGKPGDVFHFSSTRSYDPDGTIAEYLWNFGDNHTSTQITPSHTYQLPGLYLVELRVTDNDGATDFSRLYVEVDTAINVVQPEPPKVVLQVNPLSAIVAQTVIHGDAHLSYDPDGTITRIAWDWGDGSPEVTGTTATHVYARVGLYRVLVTVTDNSGLTATDDRYVRVDAPTINMPPVLNCAVTPPQGVTNVTEITVSCADSYDPDGSIVMYHVDYGDGTTSAGVTSSHVYQSAGWYTITVAIRDDDGAFVTEQRDVWIVDPPITPPVDTCWFNSMDLKVRYTQDRQEKILQNPAGEYFIRLTIMYHHMQPDFITGFELLVGDSRISYTIPDPYTTTPGDQTVEIIIPWKMYLQANQRIAFTYQTGPQANYARLLKVEGCSQPFTSQ